MKDYISSLSFDQKFALFYGILLGDGCLSRYDSNGKERRILCITGSYKDDAEFFDNILIPLIYSFTGRYPTVKLRPKWGAREIAFKNKDLFLKIESLGFNSGKKKDIPIPSIFDENLQFVIGGLFATDGCLTIVNNNGTRYPRLFFTACLPTAFRKISDYLVGNGISASCYTAKRHKLDEKSFRESKIKYVISSNGRRNTEKFRELIGFVNPKHEARYNSYLSNLMALGRFELPTSAL